MKRKLHKGLLWLCALAMVLTLGLAACGDKTPLSVTLSETSYRLELQDTLTLTATVSDGSAVTWSSSDDGVATVDGGTVTPVATGNITITATASDGATATCAIEVYELDRSPLSFTLSETSLDLVVNQDYDVTYEATQSGNAKDVTVTWSSSAPAVATVSDGHIVAVSAGTATITASVTFLGTDYSKTVEVTVSNDVALELNKSSLILHAAQAGSGETVLGDEYPLSERISATLIANGDEIESPSLTWESSDDTVATVAGDGTITAVKPGTVRIIATYDGEPEGADAYVDVTVKYLSIDKTGDDHAVVGANRGGKYDLEKIGATGTFVSVAYAENVELADGVDSTLEVNNKKFILASNVTANSPRGRVNVALRTSDNKEYIVTVYFVDWNIETLAHFNAWHQKTGEHTWGDVKTGYVALNANIDMGGARNDVSVIEHSGDGLHNFIFGGTFDGRGYEIKNVKVTGTQSSVIAAKLTSGGTIKNLKLTGVVLGGESIGRTAAGYQGGIVDWLDNGTIENCYVEGQIVNDAAAINRTVDGRGLICARVTNGSVKNCVAVLTNEIGAEEGLTEANRHRGILGNMLGVPANKAAFSDCIAIGSLYGICSQDGGKSFPYGFTEGNAEMSGVFPGIRKYDSIAAYVAANVDTSFLSDSVWVKKGNVPYIGSAAITATASTAEFNVKAGGSATIAASSPASFALQTAVNGVTLNGNVLSADETVADDVDVTVVVTSLIDPAERTTVTVKVRNVVVTDKTNLGNIADFDLTAGGNVNIDLTSVLESGDTFASLKASDGTVLATEISGNVVTVAAEKYSSFKTGVHTFGVFVTNGGVNKEYSISVTVATRVIKSVSDLDAWHERADRTNYATVKSGYIVLGADIDFGGARNDVSTLEHGGDGLVKFAFNGVFDGRGYTLKNVKVVGTQSAVIVGQLTGGGIIRNVKIVGLVLGGDNASRGANGFQGGIVDYLDNGTIENCYVEGQIVNDVEEISRTIDARGLICSRVTNGKVRNCVAVLTNTDIANVTGEGAEKSNLYRAVIGNMLGVPANSDAFKDCIAIGSLYGVCSQGNGTNFPNGVTTGNTDMSAAFGIKSYADAAAYTADKANLADYFASFGSLWNFEGDTPAFGRA